MHTFKNDMRNFHSRTVFKWMFKNQYQSNYSDQSQWEQKAWWTNQNSWQLSVSCWKCSKNQAYKVTLVLPLTVWITGTRFFSQSPNNNLPIYCNHLITFDNHFKIIFYIALSKHSTAKDIFLFWRQLRQGTKETRSNLRVMDPVLYSQGSLSSVWLMRLR